jgi:hypothetical protein
MPATPAPSPYYEYAASYLETARATGIDRTKTGLTLLAIGFLVSWVPIVGLVSIIIELIGAILVIMGRRTFGPEHARNVILSIVIFIVAIAIVFVAAIAVAFLALANYQPGINGRPSRGFLSPFMGVILFVILVGIVIFGLAQVLFTYALQKSNGRLLLWAGYASTVVVAILEFFVFTNIPYLNNALSIAPAILYGYAYYLARDRIVRGEIPAPSPTPLGQGIPASPT